MNDLVISYMAISPLLILLSARAVAVSREHRRMPHLVDIVCAPVGINVKDSKWLHALKIFFYWWFGIFFVGWLMGVQVEDDLVRSIRGILGITAFHVGCIGQTLRTIVFNMHIRPDGVTVHEENKLYYGWVEVFPGFKDLMSSLISVSTVLLVVLVPLTVLMECDMGTEAVVTAFNQAAFVSDVSSNTAQLNQASASGDTAAVVSSLAGLAAAFPGPQEDQCL